VSQKVNPLTPELSQHILNSFFFEISEPIFRLYRNKSKTCRPIFQPYKIL